ncbi:MAG TPA: ATP-binding protein [Bryobacteraceae bacterium]|nr:ATP-binding protein [Bryobacteraceae bacterium]
MGEPVRARRSILLAASLAALLLVIGISAYAVWWNARNSQERVAALQAAHGKTGVALAAIRANVYLNAILTRDYLLDSDPSHARQYNDQFTAIQADTEQSFRALEASGLDEGQQAALNRLQSELAAYLDTTEVALDWTPEEKRVQRSQMLRQRVRRREEIFGLAEQVERLVTDNFIREQQRITSADREFRVSLGWTTGIALLLGFAIAGGTLFRLLALERQSELAESELRLLSGQIRTAQEQERKYLSRELHDQVGQMLTGLRMELGSIARVLGNSESEVSSRIARAKGTVEQTLRIVRDIAMLLRPSMLDDLGLVPALAWLFKEVARPSGIEIHSNIDPALDKLPDVHRTCIYRIVQEALTNASRHSAARNVDISIRRENGQVIGFVVDDGRGFDRGAQKRGGLGLLGMEERVREVGGSVEVGSSPGKGTQIEFRLPWPESTEVMSDTGTGRGRSRDRSDGLKASA